MAEVVLSRAAAADLVDIGEYGEAHFGGAAADAYQDDVDRCMALLASHPYSGEAKPGWGKEFRGLVCNRHRIVYRVDGQTVRISRILHHSREVSRHLPK
ncbi:type II toxin-antitoxin system RelE/ParE family toxin [Novosphingobium lentum]|uniref:type II toxin-antitoxin system RelE/ParE family toxin n=1 Tax=Novosphingobium lentum TaxID=145287 RepID=UPI0008294FF8|nr:type II toxin-antitoxin system RelE/ParE family toxin [Novosphingobium lentum]